MPPFPSWDPQDQAPSTYIQIWNHCRPWAPDYILALSSLFTSATLNFLAHQALECLCLSLFYFVHGFYVCSRVGEILYVSALVAMLLEPPVVTKYETVKWSLQRIVMITYHFARWQKPFFFSSRTVFKFEKINIPKAL